MFVRLGDVVRALRALEARGGSARLALFERMWGHYAHAALGLALEWGLAERRGDVYSRGGAGGSSASSTDAPSRRGQWGEGCCLRRRSANTPWYAEPLAVGYMKIGGGLPREAAGDA